MPDHDLGIQSVAEFVANARKVDAETLARLRAEHERRLRLDESRRVYRHDPDNPRRRR